MSACAKAKIEKLVLTSSVVAIQIGHVDKNDFDESDWSITENCPPYPKSKTLAEQAAWDFIGRLPEQHKFSLTVLNPALVTGPMLSDDIGTSNELIFQMISGRMPAGPRLHMGVVDVRDVAKAHVHVMNEPSTDGMRIIMSQNELLFSNIGKVLRSEGFAKAPIHEIPTFLIKFLALLGSQLKGIRPSVGKVIRLNKKKAMKYFKNNIKETKEHNMIVDMERNDLSRICVPGSVKIEKEKTIEEYKDLFHYVSFIKGKLKDKIRTINIIKSMMPGGSVIGCPKISTLNLLNNQEKESRNIYTGSFGYIKFNGDMRFNIIIRSILNYKNISEISVASGVVIDSSASNEFNENFIKAKALIDLFK